tara:strand:+ start:1099 stop:1626 length:528 start_codon:yes stop_codon:yes gene_type:complete
MMKYFISTCALCFLIKLGLAANFLPDATYQVCFTPASHCRVDIVGQIRQAKQSIYVQAYTFSSWKLADALVSAKRRGVDVKLILDISNLQSPKANKQLIRYLKSNLPIWIDNKVSIAHNKVMIFDGKTVLTGSYNFTNAAEYYNAENVLIIHDANLAQQYLKNWQRRQSVSYRLY